MDATNMDCPLSTRKLLVTTCLYSPYIYYISMQVLSIIPDKGRFMVLEPILTMAI